MDLASEASKAVRAAKLLSSDAAELSKSIELAACARGVEAYLAAGSEDNTAYDLSLHVGARPCHTLVALTCIMWHVGIYLARVGAAAWLPHLRFSCACKAPECPQRRSCWLQDPFHLHV